MPDSVADIVVNILFVVDNYLPILLNMSGITRIIICRHCDKSSDKDDVYCSKEGQQRANLLAGIPVSVQWEQTASVQNIVPVHDECSGNDFNCSVWSRYVKDLTSLVGLYGAVLRM